MNLISYRVSCRAPVCTSYQCHSMSFYVGLCHSMSFYTIPQELRNITALPACPEAQPDSPPSVSSFAPQHWQVT